MKKPPLIPPTKSAATPKPEPTRDSPELLVMRINDHLRAVGELSTQLYNWTASMGAYINSLPKPDLKP